MSQASVDVPNGATGESLSDRIADLQRLINKQRRERLERKWFHQDNPWAWRAACRSHPRPELYENARRASKGELDQMREACAGCPVRRQCALYSVDFPGGTFAAGYRTETLRRLRDTDSPKWRAIVE